MSSEPQTRQVPCSPVTEARDRHGTRELVLESGGFVRTN